MYKYSTRVLIIGSGPAGLTAAIYAARADLSPILFCGQQPGGQLTITNEVGNYPGFANAITGSYLMDEMVKQAQNLGVRMINESITLVNLNDKPFSVVDTYNNIYIAESLIICTGAETKWLGISSEERFKGFGVSSCAICDGFFFKNKNVVVIGGGNTAVTDALYLSNLAKNTTLIHRKNVLKAEKLLQNRLLQNKSVSILWNSAIVEIIGVDTPRSVTGIKLINVLNGKMSKLECDGVFIAIGYKPNSQLFTGKLDMDEEGYIITANNSTKTSIPGVFAAGDVQDKVFRQAITAASSGCMAALEAEKFLYLLKN